MPKKPIKMLSTVRRNLLEQEGYSPYCGNTNCTRQWPRAHFNGKQFECSCGWVSEFDQEFIELYKKTWNKE